jgi:hypothetical protein
VFILDVEIRGEPDSWVPKRTTEGLRRSFTSAKRTPPSIRSVSYEDRHPQVVWTGRRDAETQSGSESQAVSGNHSAHGSLLTATLGKAKAREVLGPIAAPPLEELEEGARGQAGVLADGRPAEPGEREHPAVHEQMAAPPARYRSSVSPAARAASSARWNSVSGTAGLRCATHRDSRAS